MGPSATALSARLAPLLAAALLLVPAGAGASTGALETALTAQPPERSGSASASFSFSGPEGASFECRVDGQPFAACTSPWSVDGLSEGAHAFEVRSSVDGLVDPSPATHEWTVDLTPLEAFVDWGPWSYISSTTARFDFSFVARDGDEPIGTFECRLDGGAFDPCTSPHSYTGLAEGAHVFEVASIDRAGNRDLDSWSFTVDRTAPDTKIELGPPAEASETAARFAFTASEPGPRFQCRLDGAPWRSCYWARSYAKLATGHHRFEVRAVDWAGNVDSTPAAHSWTIAPPAHVAPPAEAPLPAPGPAPGAPARAAEPSRRFDRNKAGVKLALPVTGLTVTPSGAATLSLANLNAFELVGRAQLEVSGPAAARLGRQQALPGGAVAGLGAVHRAARGQSADQDRGWRALPAAAPAGR